MSIILLLFICLYGASSSSLPDAVIRLLAHSRRMKESVAHWSVFREPARAPIEDEATLLSSIVPPMILKQLFSLAYKQTDMCLICRGEDFQIETAIADQTLVAAKVKEGDFQQRVFDSMDIPLKELIEEFEDHVECPHCGYADVVLGRSLEIEKFPDMLMLTLEQPSGQIPLWLRLKETTYSLIGVIHKTGEVYVAEFKDPHSLQWYSRSGKTIVPLSSDPSHAAPYMALYESDEPDEEDEEVEQSFKRQKREPGLSGIRNLGNTCYLNAILQLLSHATAFRDAILSHPELEEPSEDLPTWTDAHYGALLANRIRALIHSQWKEDETLDPEDILQILDAMGIFPPGIQHDAHEALRTILGYISDAHAIQLTGSVAPHDSRAQTIAELFGIRVDRSSTCSICNHQAHRPDNMEEVILSFGTAMEDTTLEQLLERYLADETIEGTQCQSCGVKSDTVTHSKLAGSSPLFLFVLSRFEQGSQRIMTRVSVPAKLTVDNAEFRLIGIVHHIGASLAEGHYTTDFRHPDNGLWFDANDEHVTLLPNGPRAGGRTPYLILYEKM